MTDLVELERRIANALNRLEAGIDRLRSETPPAETADGGADLAELRVELDAERASNAELTEKIASLRARDARQDVAGLEAKIADLTRQLDVQGLELHRMRKSTIQLREALRAMNEEGVAGAEGNVINKAMLAELEALRALRASEAQELSELVAELLPIVGEEEADA